MSFFPSQLYLTYFLHPQCIQKSPRPLPEIPPAEETIPRVASPRRPSAVALDCPRKRAYPPHLRHLCPFFHHHNHDHVVSPPHRCLFPHQTRLQTRVLPAPAPCPSPRPPCRCPLWLRASPLSPGTPLRRPPRSSRLPPSRPPALPAPARPLPSRVRDVADVVFVALHEWPRHSESGAGRVGPAVEPPRVPPLRQGGSDAPGRADRWISS